MTKTIGQMSAEEYKRWLYDNPEEAKKLDTPANPEVPRPTSVWRNGVLVQLVDNTQITQNGVIK
jgi:hypothetical protein